MEITKFGHSCMLLSTGDARLLIDPGVFSSGFENLAQVDGLLVTHQHHDHFDRNRVLDLLARHPNAQVVTDVETAGLLAGEVSNVTAARNSETLVVGGAKVSVHGDQHVVIHPDLVNVANVGYFVDDLVFHPGDALTVPEAPVEVLALPIGAPWLTVGSAIDYLRAVRPRIAIAVHERVFSAPNLAYGLLGRFAEEQGTTFVVLEQDESITV